MPRLPASSEKYPNGPLPRCVQPSSCTPNERLPRSPRDNQAEFRNHIVFAESYVDKLAAADHRSAFVRTWRVLVLAFFHEGRFVLAADQFGRRAHDAGGDSAEFLLALGATEEMAWWIHHEEDEDPGIKGDLKDAERHYRQALILAPDLVEARVRLGHVLLLRDDAEGLKILAQVGESAEVPIPIPGATCSKARRSRSGAISRKLNAAMRRRCH